MDFKVLDHYWGVEIEGITHDYRNSTVLINLIDRTNGEHLSIFFKDVALLMWVSLSASEDIVTNIFPEFTSIVDRNVNLTTNDKWLKQFSLNFNICIEIVDRALLLHTSKFEFKGKLYDLI